MDSWTEKQIDKMRLGGNDRCNAFLARYDVPKNMNIDKKYNTPAALFYREMLNAEANGLPIPTPPEKFESTTTDTSSEDPVQKELRAREVSTLVAMCVIFFFSSNLVVIII